MSKGNTSKHRAEFLIGWRDLPFDKHDTWEPMTTLTGSDNMICCRSSIKQQRYLSTSIRDKHADCSKIITMPNGGSQAVLQHFLMCHTVLNVKVRTLNLTTGAVKNPPNIMNLLNQGFPESVPHEPTINRSIMQSAACY
jgi:hypothetical protein